MSMSNTETVVKEVRTRLWGKQAFRCLLLPLVVQIVLAEEFLAAKTLLWGDRHLHTSFSGDTARAHG